MPGTIYLSQKRKTPDCDCEDEKPKFINSKSFLAIVTAFTILMLAFPHYSHIFYGNTNREVGYVDQSNIEKLNFDIVGMTCSGCEAHIEGEVNKLAGIVSVTANYKKANAIVKYDKSKISANRINEALMHAGYKIVNPDAQNKDMKMNENDNITFYEVGLVCNAAPGLGCGSRSKPILLEFDQQKEVKEAQLNKKGTLIKIVWEDNIDFNSKKYIADRVFKNNKMNAKLSIHSETETSVWLNVRNIDKLSKEEAGIIANQMIVAFKEKGNLTTEQEDHLKVDIQTAFYNFFLNFNSLDELSSTFAYKNILLKVIDSSKAYLDTEQIPDVDILLKFCIGHSENCTKSGCCKNREIKINPTKMNTVNSYVKTRSIGRILRLILGLFFVTEVYPVYRDVTTEGALIRLGWALALVAFYVLLHLIIVKYLQNINMVLGAILVFGPFLAVFFYWLWRTCRNWSIIIYFGIINYCCGT